jgi:hypothetical protein
MEKLALACPIAALWVFAHTIRTGETKKRKAELPSLSAPHEHIIRPMTSAELQLSHVDRPSELIRHV